LQGNEAIRGCASILILGEEAMHLNALMIGGPFMAVPNPPFAASTRRTGDTMKRLSLREIFSSSIQRLPLRIGRFRQRPYNQLEAPV
jgi:hypothetical protein